MFLSLPNNNAVDEEASLMQCRSSSDSWNRIVYQNFQGFWLSVFWKPGKMQEFDQEKLGKYLLVYKECSNYKVVILLPLLFLSWLFARVSLLENRGNITAHCNNAFGNCFDMEAVKNVVRTPAILVSTSHSSFFVFFSAIISNGCIRDTGS